MQKNGDFVARFALGATLVTRGVNALILAEKLSPSDLLRRHQSGDWGDVGRADRESNEFALRDGGRLLSVYKLEDGTRIWCISEADRSSTTLLLPSEY